VRYRSKWRIALEQHARLRENGVVCDWWTFDEGYGSKPGFLHELEQRKQCYVGEVPRSFRCHGRVPSGKHKSSWAEDIVRHSRAFRNEPWQRVRLARQTLGAQEWEVKAAQVWLPWDRTRTYWLIWARNARSGEEKYFVSNASVGTKLEVLLRVAFRRWPIEHSFRVSKGEMGFRHYEGRSYVGLMRHLVLCLVVMRFAAGEAERLRGEKPGGDSGASLHGAESAERGMAGGSAGDDGVGVHVDEVAVLSAA
jgi:SRSO17 transposase